MPAFNDLDMLDPSGLKRCRLGPKPKWAELQGILNFIIKLVGFLYFWRIWHLGEIDSMENTPTVCADDLPTILEIFKNTQDREV